MSIDVHIYSTLDVSAAQTVVARLRADHPALFPEQFLLRDASVPSAFRRRHLDDEFDFEARSGFAVRLVNKRRTDLPETVRLVRSYFDDHSVLSLFENESVFPAP